METELLIRIILDVLIIVLGLILIFGRSYLSEKGKNIATKEDIEEITKKIEIVKNEVGINSQRKMQYLNERKKACIDFLNSISIWLDFTLRPMSLLYNNPLDKKILLDIISDLKEKGANATTNYWNLFVYFDNEKLIEIIDGVYHSCLDLHNLTNQLLINIERKANEANRKKEIFEIVKYLNQKEEINESLHQINKEINELIEKFVIDRKEINEKAILNRFQFVILLNKMFKIKTPVNNVSS